MDVQDEAPVNTEQELPELRNAFSQTTVEVREQFIEEHMRQVQEQSNSGSPSSSIDMKRANSVSINPTLLNTSSLTISKENSIVLE